MTPYREILRLHSLGTSQRSIASCCGCSRNTVANVLQHAQEQGLTWPLPEKATDEILARELFPREPQVSGRRSPDYEHVHKELAKSGVTLSLLWSEYCEQCRNSGEIPYMYTQFCFYYRQFAEQKKATMHLEHKPGEQMEVDWAGDPAKICDPDTGKVQPAFVFIAALSCSGYAYVEAFLDEGEESWICGHVNAFRYFSGVTRILVPDNLKTGVDRHTYDDIVLNRSYQELAEHYGTCILPARVRHPKDKPRAEDTVGIISTWIIAALRNRTFFSLYELNDAIREKLKVFNNKPFQKKPGSRAQAFADEEKAFLLPLPVQPYEFAVWKTATVQYNYHIAVDKMFYSVPCAYIKQKVDVRVSHSTIEAFFGVTRIASHVRLHGKPGQYSTVTDHMPESHQQYLQWDGERFCSWASKVGPHTETVVKVILASHKIEQQGYRSCLALLKLGDVYSVSRLEAACARALQYTPSPSFKSIQTILKSGSDRLVEESAEKKSTDNYAFTRGASYYGGDK